MHHATIPATTGENTKIQPALDVTHNLFIFILIQYLLFLIPDMHGLCVYPSDSVLDTVQSDYNGDWYEDGYIYQQVL